MRLRIRMEHLKRRQTILLIFLGWICIIGLVGLFTGGYSELIQASLSPNVWARMLAPFWLVVKPFLAILPAALVAAFVIPKLATRFIRNLYDLESDLEARLVFTRNLFGLSGIALKPLILVREGRIIVGAGSPSDIIGGPALLVVHNDSAVVLEKGGRLTRVVGPLTRCGGMPPGICFLERFERVWEVVDLSPQRWPFTVSAMTKEGIPIKCQADIIFKIDDRYLDQDGNVQVKAPTVRRAAALTDERIEKELRKGGIGMLHPYTDEAVFNAATSIWVRIRQPNHGEQLRKWTGRVVIGNVEGTLRSILYDYWLDDLMQPSDALRRHPREEIQDQLEKRLREALPVGNAIGARILDVKLGQIDVDVADVVEEEQGVSMQWVKFWRAVNQQKAIANRIEGETELAGLQAEQVMSQAEMVLALVDAIRPFTMDNDEKAISSYELATRFVGTLWWLSYSHNVRAFLPPDTIRTLDALQEALERESGGERRQLKPPEESAQQ